MKTENLQVKEQEIIHMNIILEQMKLLMMVNGIMLLWLEMLFLDLNQ